VAHKIFVSYKFADDNVYNINGKSSCTVRDYVNELENELSKAHHIYKGESDDEDLSHLSEETIWKKLRDRIYDSSLTIVMISQNMKLPEFQRRISGSLGKSLTRLKKRLERMKMVMILLESQTLFWQL